MPKEKRGGYGFRGARPVHNSAVASASEAQDLREALYVLLEASAAYRIAPTKTALNRLVEAENAARKLLGES
jgi:hypothetical protein